MPRRRQPSLCSTSAALFAGAAPEFRALARMGAGADHFLRHMGKKLALDSGELLRLLAAAGWHTFCEMSWR
jgi:hypothetical protein